MAFWQEGIDKIEAAAKAGGYALRLDNATRCPHTTAKQKQQERLNLFLKDKSRRDYT